jgi:hypothetical protein
MKRRIAYGLAAAALIAVAIAGAVGASEATQAMTVTSGLEIISGNDRAVADGHAALAGRGQPMDEVEFD